MIINLFKQEPYGKLQTFPPHEDKLGYTKNEAQDPLQVFTGSMGNRKQRGHNRYVPHPQIEP